MTTQIATGSVHHLTLTVTDVARSVEFYTGLLGFQKAMDFGCLMHKMWRTARSKILGKI
ncbi:MAG: VOC family protein [Caldilineaceae bacterium]|nr:VOC family protein [Caldilineaceae bacterium]MCB0116161.1 VOC family protein [Caldilineaceae bacterium]MCB0120918.1 VOC family protein [Caldilineaceae bacterium]